MFFKVANVNVFLEESLKDGRIANCDVPVSGNITLRDFECGNNATNVESTPQEVFFKASR